MTVPLQYTDDVETSVDNEEAVIDETIELMRSTMAKTFEQHRHATSGTHAKSHGLLTGTLRVVDDLPPEMAQGMFATPASYDAVMRIASEPGQIDDDQVKRARGVTLKLLDVPGEKLREGWTSHDWLFNTWPVIPDGDAATYLIAIRQRERHAGHHLLTSATTLARVRDLGATLFDRTPNIHPLAHTYYTQSAFRFGAYVAKLRLAPLGAEQRALADRKVSGSDSPGVLAEWVAESMTASPARFSLDVQLRTDADTMPVEDASVEWPEDASPYRTVAVLDLPTQATFTPARRVYSDDVLAGRPWNGLVAHRPLGSINRVRRRAYEQLGQWRHDMNAVEHTEPLTLADLPF